MMNNLYLCTQIEAINNEETLYIITNTDADSM